MPLGQRIAHMRPEERLGVLNLFEEPIVSPLEGLAQVVPRLAETAVPFVGRVGDHDLRYPGFFFSNHGGKFPDCPLNERPRALQAKASRSQEALRPSRRAHDRGNSAVA